LIRRLLLLLFAVLFAAWWSRRLLSAARGSQPAAEGRGSRREVKDLGPMVRDRVCNTFLPRSRALRLTVGSEEHYFCSETCRREFEAKQTAHSA
jgi:YHS domain-containing protein